MIDVADHHHISVVRHIPALVPVARILGRHVLEVVHPADDRPTIGVRLEGNGIHCFKKQGLRLIVGAQPALFHDDPDLLLEFLGGQRQMAHAISLQRHHFLQPVRRHLLEIGRVITAGEGIVAATGRSDKAIELARPDLRRTLEHHVFQHMGNAGGAVALVHRAGAVPDHVRCRRCATVLLDDDAQAVGQPVLEGIGQRRKCSGGKKAQAGGQNVSS